MTQLLEFRKRLIEIYQKIDYIVMPLCKFILALCGFLAIKNVIGFNPRFSSLIIILALSFIAAFIPESITLAIMVLYIALQLYSVSVFMAGTVIVLAIIIFCFFIRFITKYSAGVIGMPVLMGINLPYTLPICFGLFTSPVTIVPTSVGVFAYYFLSGIKANITTLEQVSSADEPYVLFTNVLTNVLKNEEMFATMIVFSLVNVVVYCIRRIRMDYSFEIATGVGSAVSMLGFIVLMLKFDFSSSILSIIFFSIISGVISLIVYNIYRPLRYAATESVQFEDDDYYYYVKAVPKIKITGAKVNERQIINRRRDDDDDIDDEEFEDLESRIMNVSDDELVNDVPTSRRGAESSEEEVKLAQGAGVARRQAMNPNRPNSDASTAAALQAQRARAQAAALAAKKAAAAGSDTAATSQGAKLNPGRAGAMRASARPASNGAQNRANNTQAGAQENPANKQL